MKNSLVTLSVEPFFKFWGHFWNTNLYICVKRLFSFWRTLKFNPNLWTLIFVSIENRGCWDQTYIVFNDKIQNWPEKWLIVQMSQCRLRMSGCCLYVWTKVNTETLSLIISVVEWVTDKIQQFYIITSLPESTSYRPFTLITVRNEVAAR